jgi:Na+/proline symporter
VRSSRGIHNTLDYTVAGRDVAWIVVLATTAATMVGGGASIGSVSSVYQDGLVFALVTCAWHIQLIVTGLWIAPRLRQLNLLTVSQAPHAKGPLSIVAKCHIFAACPPPKSKSHGHLQQGTFL